MIERSHISGRRMQVDGEQERVEDGALHVRGVGAPAPWYGFQSGISPFAYARCVTSAQALAAQWTLPGRAGSRTRSAVGWPGNGAYAVRPRRRPLAGRAQRSAAEEDRRKGNDHDEARDQQPDEIGHGDAPDRRDGAPSLRRRPPSAASTTAGAVTLLRDQDRLPCSHASPLPQDVTSAPRAAQSSASPAGSWLEIACGSPVHHRVRVATLRWERAEAEPEARHDPGGRVAEEANLLAAVGRNATCTRRGSRSACSRAGRASPRAPSRSRSGRRRTRRLDALAPEDLVHRERDRAAACRR